MKQINHYCRYLLMLLLLIGAASRGFAQPFSLDDRIKPVLLELVDYKKDDPKKKGRINITNVVQESDTLYYYVQGLSMYSPAYFSLHTTDAASPVKVKLCKDNWHTANRDGETDEKGQWNTKFKTEGDFGIMVISPTKPATYTLLTWVADEAKEIGMGSPFKDGGGSESSVKGKGFLAQNGLYLGIGAVLVAIIIFLLIKRKK